MLRVGWPRSALFTLGRGTKIVLSAFGKGPVDGRSLEPLFHTENIPLLLDKNFGSTCTSASDIAASLEKMTDYGGFISDGLAALKLVIVL